MNPETETLFIKIRFDFWKQKILRCCKCYFTHYLSKGRPSAPAREWTREQSQARALGEGWEAGPPPAPHAGEEPWGWGSPRGLVVTGEPSATKMQTSPPPPTGQPVGAVSIMPAGRHTVSTTPRGPGPGHGEPAAPSTCPPGRCVQAHMVPGDTAEGPQSTQHAALGRSPALPCRAEVRPHRQLQVWEQLRLQRPPAPR